jgi:hypothetical protein
MSGADMAEATRPGNDACWPARDFFAPGDGCTIINPSSQECEVRIAELKGKLRLHRPPKAGEGGLLADIPGASVLYSGAVIRLDSLQRYPVPVGLAVGIGDTFRVGFTLTESQPFVGRRRHRSARSGSKGSGSATRRVVGGVVDIDASGLGFAKTRPKWMAADSANN